MKKVRIFDSTLRDGSHANKHTFTKNHIVKYCSAMDLVGVDAIFVGHGNGLGASSAQIGFSKVSDIELINTAKSVLKNTKLGTYLIPGFGTIKDHIAPAIEAGTDIFEVGCHCTEADISRQHIEFIKKSGKEAFGTLMMIHMASTEVLLENAKKMESYGADGIILMDSSGNCTPEMVERIVSLLSENLSIPIGMHAHNNLGLAIQNTLTALRNGASIVDGTMRGYGAGAGNCQLEIICSLLSEKYSEYNIDVDYMNLLKTSDAIMKDIMHKEMGVDAVSISSGLAGVFSAFKEHAIKAGIQFDVSPIDILTEVGKRKAVGGQEDIIIEIASAMRKK